MSEGSDQERFVAKYFKDIEAVLAAQHTLAPRQHSGDKGEDREAFLVKTLNNHLPAAARAHRGGTIIDSLDNRSRQTDIIVYSNTSPVLAQQAKPFFLAEGVFAAIEVKSTLTARGLKAAQDACIKIKRLRRFTLSKGEDEKAEFTSAEQVAVGVFAYGSKYRDFTGPARLLLNLHQTGIKNTEMLDFVCVNQEFCLTRDRTEFVVSATVGGKALRPIEEVNASCSYRGERHAFAGMLQIILGRIPYVGFFHNNIGHYVNHWVYSDGFI